MGYPGGKGRSYQYLISLMPPHRVYIETHLGGGAVMRAKRPADVNIGVEVDPAVVALWRRGCPSHIDLVEDDAVAFLSGYPFRGDELVFCDPPYLPSTRRRSKVYRRDYREGDHVEMLEILKDLSCSVILCGYHSELYDRALPGWKRIDRIERTQCGPRVECVWLNYEAPPLLHDHAHLGRTFREREAIRRRRTRLADRIQALPTLERSALLAELAIADPTTYLKVAEILG